MIDDQDIVIYIGKAKSLKKRVKQYFRKNYQHSSRTKKLLEKIHDLTFTAVDSELEAMILETNLIKQFQPKYNVIMKDDKNYVYIKIGKEQFPKIEIVRKIEKDGAKYIGPKTAAIKVKETFKLLKKIFPFRHCSLEIEYKNGKTKIGNKVIKYPCLDYYIKRCNAPCIGKISPEKYQKIIKNIENFLQGKTDDIVTKLNKEMQQHAQDKNFEKAAKTRDKILKIQSILEKQKVSDPNQEDKDVINYLITHQNAYFNLFQIRDGKLIGQENFILKARDIEEKSNNTEVLEAFIKQYYKLATDIPKEILIPHELENQPKLKQFIMEQAQKGVKFLIPQRGDKNKLLEMSLNNARIYADRHKPSWQQESENTKKAIKELQEILKIEQPLNRIECYDISHLSGTDTVGSMIVFEKGIPKKTHYRKFKLKTVQNRPDDYKSMQEVLTRRFGKIAYDLLHKDYIFKKATKTHQKSIEKNAKTAIKENKLSYKDFYILEKDKKFTGMITVLELSKKVSTLKGLWVPKNQRGNKLGHKLIKEAIKKAKANRVYIICKQDLHDYYAMFGFEDVNKTPDELKDHKNECQGRYCQIPLVMVYDKTKHKNDESFSSIPDLVVIDGGKGQLSAAEKVFTELKIDIPVISLAKRLEEIFVPNIKTSIILSKDNEALKLLQRARDEAHRFAISYNKKLRSKRIK